MRIAIVNDLGLAREVLKRVVLSVPGHAVAWTAENGEEAVRRAAVDRPDIILMDLVMPVMDGVEATRRIMAQSPCPILLVTSSVSGNLSKVYEAMGHGGLDAVNTPVLGPDGNVRDSEGMLARIAKLARLKTWKGGDEPRAGRDSVHGVPPAPAAPLVVMGASTGGPEALAQILGALPASFPAGVLVVQHIAADFAPSLATWLGGRSRMPVRAAREGAEVKPGEVLVASSDDHLVVRADRRLAYRADPVDNPYRPSVDVLFGSVARNWPERGVAVLLTGMGQDGASGLGQLKKLGWHTIAQDQATCVVYGMPKAAAELNAASQILPLPHIASTVQTRVTGPRP